MHRYCSIVPLKRYSSPGTTMNETGKSGTGWLDAFGLNERHRQFVQAYLDHPNATKAARDVGYRHPNTQGPRLMKHPKIARAVATGRGYIERRMMREADEVLRQWVALALSDATELTQLINVPCRYCYGVDHQYQWRTKREYKDELLRQACAFYPGESEAAITSRQKIMEGLSDDPRVATCNGGFGYRTRGFPNPDCPECDGYGVQIVKVADTRNLSPGARILLDGVEETIRGGRKVRTRSRDRALTQIAKHLGLFDHKKPADREREILQEMAERIMADATTVPVVRH